mmetsp:Transcript_8475/g.12638  ORF Transcript_8475/g.12638 Transcript_8475/m.12638 type:complete len:192 (+) Transcript_8475:107-682(+)
MPGTTGLKCGNMNSETVVPGRSTKVMLGKIASDDEERDNGDECGNYFEASRSLRESLSTPELAVDGSLKQRVHSLEQAIKIQVRRDDVTYQNIIALSKDSERIEKGTRQMVMEKHLEVDEEVKQFKQEVHHRFELQTAENKRLQQHVTSLKAENHQLQRDLAMVLERLKKLELEFGEDENVEENERPHTTI